jgi:hypothetical protein
MMYPDVGFDNPLCQSGPAHRPSDRRRRAAAALVHGRYLAAFQPEGYERYFGSGSSGFAYPTSMQSAAWHAFASNRYTARRVKPGPQSVRSGQPILPRRGVLMSGEVTPPCRRAVAEAPCLRARQMRRGNDAAVCGCSI